MKRLAQVINSEVSRAARNFPWPIIKQLKRLQVIEVSPYAEKQFLVITTPSKIWDALWTAYTFLYHHAETIDLVIVVDGPVTAFAVSLVSRQFPGARVVGREEIGRALPSRSSLKDFFFHSRFGAKLCAISLFSRDKPLIYSDSDILFFRRSPDIVDWLNGQQRHLMYVCANVGGGQPDSSTEFSGLAKEIVPRNFNSGFFACPRCFFNDEFLEEALLRSRRHVGGKPVEGAFEGRMYFSGWDYFTDQSVIGSGAGMGMSRQLPLNDFCHSNNGSSIFSRDPTDYSKIVMRHYFGIVRHRLYMDGMPYALAQMESDSA